MSTYTLIRVSPHHRIAFSKVNYQEEAILFKLLSSSNIELKELSNISNQRRKVEWMTIRSILLSVHSKHDDIIYDINGKPHFSKSHSHLSISHSQEMVALSINDNIITGIDIQRITNKIIRIKNKFLNEIEQKNTSENVLELTYYWSIKEALFKVYGKKNAFLKEHIGVTEVNFDERGGYAKGYIKCGSHFSEHKIELKKIENYVLAYVVNS